MNKVMKRATILAVLISCVLFLSVGHAMAAEDNYGTPSGSHGNMEISAGEYLSSNPGEDTEVIKPQMRLIMSFALAVFVFLSFLCVVCGGSLANLGSLLKSNSLRKDGIIAIFTVVAVILLVSVAWMAIPNLYNHFVVGNL